MNSLARCARSLVTNDQIKSNPKYISTEEGPRTKIYFGLLFIWSLVSTVEHEVILHHNDTNDAQTTFNFIENIKLSVFFIAFDNSMSSIIGYMYQCKGTNHMPKIYASHFRKRICLRECVNKRYIKANAASIYPSVTYCCTCWWLWAP